MGSVGQCIYCHTNCQPLSTEHIIPYGLNGPWKLLEASCKRCAGITAGFERAVQKTTFDTVRIGLNFPSRKKKDQPPKLPLAIERGGKREVVHLPVEDYPAAIVMPHFEVPAYLAGREGEQLRTTRSTFVQIGGPPVLRFQKSQGRSRLRA